jgi:acyl-CoA thioesterase FadM
VGLWFRLIWLAIAGQTRAACGLAQVCITPLRVWPSDLDIFGYVCNAKYLALMDLANIDWLTRSGKWRMIMKARMMPMVTRSGIRYRRSMRLGQSFRVESSLVAWNEKDFFALQRFMVAEECIAEGLVQARFFRKGAGSVPSEETFATIYAQTPQPRVFIEGPVTFDAVWAATIKD